VSWCDKLASTPTVGLRLDKIVTPVALLLEPFTPVVSTWVDKDRDQLAFTVDHQDLYSATLQTYDGYAYQLSPEILTVDFKHRLRWRANSAGPPTAELLSKPRPYTDVLGDVTSRLLQLVELVTRGRPRKLRRIGVVTTTLASVDEVPPGFMRFVKHVSNPWDTMPDAYNIELTAKLPAMEKSAAYSDRCIHVVSRPEDGEGLVTVRLDYQRVFEGEKGLNLGSLPTQIGDVQKAALKYFEDIAEGGRFDA
jgi:hypothetical protein